MVSPTTCTLNLPSFSSAARSESKVSFSLSMKVSSFSLLIEGGARSISRVDE